MKKPELLLPAGTLSKLQVAIDYGADAVYAGVAGFSMRPDGAAFTIDDFNKAVDITHKAGKKIYAALNIMAFNNDLEKVQSWLEQIRGIDIDALIIGDAGVFNLARRIRPELPIHISTQMGIANSESASFWKEQGAERIILARECSLQDARSISMNADIEVEAFIHGAMCVAVSGRCILSAYFSGKSGSRGQCKHSCRWDYQLIEKTRPENPLSIVESERGTVLLGSKDLCLINHIPELIQSGLSSLKVEGRMKSEYYVAVVARVYRAAIDSYFEDPEKFTFNDEWLRELYAVSHRPYCTGFAFGYPNEDPSELQTENKYYMTHELTGIVREHTEQKLAIFVKNPFRPGDELSWIAPGGASGTITINDDIKNETGGAWDIARPTHTVTVSYKGDMPPINAMLRRELDDEGK